VPMSRAVPSAEDRGSAPGDHPRTGARSGRRPFGNPFRELVGPSERPYRRPHGAVSDGADGPGRDMLLRMAIATLRGERAVAATLVGLLLLSALLACAGTALLARLAGAGETLLDRADAPHLVQMHRRERDR